MMSFSLGKYSRLGIRCLHPQDEEGAGGQPSRFPPFPFSNGEKTG
jgi:hypothetical protein